MRTASLTLILLAAVGRADEKKDDQLVLSDEEKGVLERTNAERRAAGLPALVPNAKLFKAAREHSANMARQAKLAHDLDDKKPADRVKEAGYEFGSVGENVAWNQPHPAEVLKTWMNSEGHKANILNAEFTEIGVGVAKNAKGERYWTQVFGKPLR